jgi:hypothetical protein
MTDQELRAMIRDAIARHIGPDAVRLPALRSAEGPAPRSTEGTPDTTGTIETGRGETGMYASHTRLALLRSGDDDGRCLIEPAVRCNHCGYCVSYGH